MSLHHNSGSVAPLRRMRERGFGMMPCPNCGDVLLAPDHSEYMGDGRVRHHWACEGCGHEFQASIDVAPR